MKAKMKLKLPFYRKASKQNSMRREWKKKNTVQNKANEIININHVR